MPGVGPLETYLDKVRTCAYTITDADVQAVKDAGVSEDEIFERTVAVAVEEGRRRLDSRGAGDGPLRLEILNGEHAPPRRWA